MIATGPQMTVEEVREVFSIPAHWPVEWNARTGCWQTTKPPTAAEAIEQAFERIEAE